MSVPISVLSSQVADPARCRASGLDAARHQAVAAVLHAGRSGASGLTPALQAYWRLLGLADETARADVLERVRRAIRSGEATLRAWAPIALAEIDPELAESAVQGYLGVGPVSLDRRAQAVADVLDWIRRDLPLNRAAAFAALLALHDESVDAALAGLRGRLAADETAAVWQRLAGDACPQTRQFIEQWQAEA